MSNKHPMMKQTMIAGLAALMTATTIQSADTTPTSPVPGTTPAARSQGLGLEFLKNAKFGIFVHYTRSTPYAFGEPNPAIWDLDAQAAAFDVKAFADSVEQMGAQYVTMTAFHAAMYLMGPSKVMCDIGMPTHQAKRDMLGDLADELNKRGIALCLYVHPVDQHDLTKEERALFGWGSEVDGLPGPRLGLWPNPKWDAFILDLFKEISLRYGERVSGYWIDRHTPKRFENAKRMAVALRAGNPNAVIWQSGPDYVQDGLSLEDAWPAAESGYSDRGSADQCCVMPTGDWALGTEVKIPAAEVFRAVARCAGCPGQKGGIHIALTPFATGYPPKVKELMADFGKLWRERKVSLLNTRPSTIVEPVHNLPWDIVATDSADGTTVYVHVLIPPAAGKSIRLPAPKNGQRFSAAVLLLGGKAVKLSQSADGLELSLPADVNWDAADTVIALKFAAPATASGEAVSIFNGKDLAGWEGAPGWWTVEEGALTAQSIPEKPCKECNYLVWKGGQPANFELTCDFRLSASANSGVQIRSETRPNWDTFGYQADMTGDGGLVGYVYHHQRGLIAARGERVTIAADGKKEVQKIGDSAELLKNFKKEDWNRYRIICRGPDITLYVNGVLMCQITDNDASTAAKSGIIALQMHPGPPMKVQFKNLVLKELK